MTSTIDAPDDTTATSRDPLSYGKVFGHARTGTAELSKATGGLAFLLLRGAWTVARQQAAKARASKAANSAPASPIQRTADTAANRGKKRKAIALLAGGAAVAAVLAGAAAILRARRRGAPPAPAAAPPSLAAVKPAATNGAAAPEPAAANTPSRPGATG